MCASPMQISFLGLAPTSAMTLCWKSTSSRLPHFIAAAQYQRLCQLQKSITPIFVAHFLANHIHCCQLPSRLPAMPMLTQFCASSSIYWTGLSHSGPSDWFNLLLIPLLGVFTIWTLCVQPACSPTLIGLSTVSIAAISSPLLTATGMCSHYVWMIY